MVNDEVRRIMKGILLAGGAGSRLHPATKAISKHFMMVYDKPLIYYSLSNLMLAGIREVLLISSARDLEFYKNLFSDGKSLGIRIEYEVQDSPNGIPEAFIIGESFIKNSNVALALGDNIFFGTGFSSLLQSIKGTLQGSHILTKKVEDPNRFGVANIVNGAIESLEEKPKNSKSNLAITGMYFFDSTVSERTKQLKYSERGEFEIIDLLDSYNKDKLLIASELPRGTFWLDTGTSESMLDASLFIRTVEQHTGLLVGSPEEIALRNNWISIELLKSTIKDEKSTYFDMLQKIILNHHDK
jgi:glucose-1-phosphate thymidylyltransferase